MDAMVINYEQLSEDYSRIEQAIEFLEEHFRQQPDLRDIAAYVGLSEYHFQRLFTRWVGISPKRFLQFLTKEYAMRLLEGHENILSVTYDTGLSSPSRLHDLFVSCEAVTPGEYKQKGSGITIQYGFHPTPFGECLLAVTQRGICFLAFVYEGGRQQAYAELQHKWKNANLVEDPHATQPFVAPIFNLYASQEINRLTLLLNGTNFQVKVWEALLRIPPGKVVTYEDLAVSIGMPGAARAVSNAVGQNPIPVLIPCHRVIRKEGIFGGYHYGRARKQALLAWEAVKYGMEAGVREASEIESI